MTLDTQFGQIDIYLLETTVVQGQRCMTTWVLRKETAVGSRRVGSGS